MSKSEKYRIVCAIVLLVLSSSFLIHSQSVYNKSVVDMPNVVGLTVDEALQKCDSIGILEYDDPSTWQVKTEDENDVERVGFASAVVYKQYPASGEKFHLKDGNGASSLCVLYVK